MGRGGDDLLDKDGGSDASQKAAVEEEKWEESTRWDEEGVTG